MKATIVYYSHKGKTAAYAHAMAMYLWSKGLSVSLCATSDFDEAKLSDTDFLLSGCWTCGWFVVGQHPHARWRAFAHRIRGRLPEKVLLFTTYKIRTGSMFGCMRRALGLPRNRHLPVLKSRTGFLTEADKATLDRFIQSLQ